MTRTLKKMRARKVSGSHVRGAMNASRARIGIVVARFNEYFTYKLLDAAVDTLLSAGVAESHIDIFHVPGAFEIPIVVKRALAKKKYDAMITLGVVIRGETRHFNHVVDAAAKGTMDASLGSDIPVIHGVVAAEDESQAVARVGGKLGNKGREAALAAIEMANLMREVERR